MAEGDPLGRRGFFRRGLLDLIKPLAQAVEPMRRVAEQIGQLEQEIGSAIEHSGAPTQHWLRPPGALEETRFREQCSRSGECVRACPAQAIKLDYSGMEGEGVPYIDANAMSCVLCTGLACMYACPSGSILPTEAQYIDMGTAQWHESYCLRSTGQDCTICIDTCPVGVKAIQLDDSRVQVLTGGCTGCGVCQHQCPTTPKAITILPKSAR